MQEVTFGERRAWLVTAGRAVVVTIISDSDEFVGLWDGGTVCGRTPAEAACLALEQTTYPLSDWPAAVPALHEARVPDLHPDDFDLAF